jgi:hypothetical protein
LSVKILKVSFDSSSEWLLSNNFGCGSEGFNILEAISFEFSGVVGTSS